MIVELGLGLNGKIRGLTVDKIHVPCDCKILKIEPYNPEFDILVDLCSIHEKKYNDMKGGKIESQVLIPGLQVDRE